MQKPATTSPLVPFHRETLPNGTTLLVKENHSVPLAAVDLWVATGAVREKAHEGGISHFLEHLFFKGTAKRPVGVMDREIKSLGGYNNAATSYDFTHYYVVLPSEHADLALDILLDALLNMDLPPEEIERERQVILEEIARRDDSPLGKLYDDFLEKIFSGSPYERPILGTPESLAGIGRDEFLDYRARHYGPQQLHVSVAGDVDPLRISECVQRLTQNLKPVADSNPLEEVTFSPNGNVEFEIEKDVQQTYFLFGQRTPAIQGTDDEIALDLISTVLGEGRSSRLVSRLVEQTGLCSTATAFVWTLDQVGLFGVETCHNAESEDEVLGIVWEELDRIREEPIPEAEIEKAQTLMLTSYAYSLERVSSMAGVLGKNSANGNIEAVLSYPERVKRMTAESACETLNRCCPKDRHAIGFVRPEKKA